MDTTTAVEVKQVDVEQAKPTGLMKHEGRSEGGPVSLMPTPDQYRMMLSMADTFVQTGFLPASITTAQQALTIMLTGRELNLPPMLALRMIHVIDGKPGLASELQLARFRQAGGRYRWIEKTDRIATIQVIAPGNPADWAETFSFTIDEARAAELLGKKNWKKYPAAMLRARAASLAIRAVAPEVSMGLYDPDELGAVTNEAGEIEQWPEPASSPVREARRQDDPLAHDDRDDDPILPIDRLMEQEIRLSDDRCHVGVVLGFCEIATKTVETTKRYQALIQKCWAILPQKVLDATVEQLTNTLAWLDAKPERAKAFRKWGDAIVDRLNAINDREPLPGQGTDSAALNEVLTRPADKGLTETVAMPRMEFPTEGGSVVIEPSLPKPVVAAAESDPAELFDETGPGGTFEIAGEHVVDQDPE